MINNGGIENDSNKLRGILPSKQKPRRSPHGAGNIAAVSVKKNLSSTISFRVQSDEYNKFVSQCVAANMSKSKLFRDYIARNTIPVRARSAVSRESRRAVQLLQTASNNINVLLRRANSDSLAGTLASAYYFEFIKQLALLNKFMLDQTTVVRRDS